MSDPQTTNASTIDAWADGMSRAQCFGEREAPECFTPAARAEWYRGYDEAFEALNDDE